jgi:hypothetical protein
LASVLAQVTGQSDLLSNIVTLAWFGFILITFFFSQTIMIMQIIFKSERSVLMLEDLAIKGKKKVLKKIAKGSNKEITDKVNKFMDFFVIEPVGLDPYGIVQRIEHLVNLSEGRFRQFVEEVAPELGEEEKANLVMGVSGAVSLNQIAKIVRHYLEMTKKTKNLQFAVMLQMLLPLAEKLSKAMLNGTDAFINGWAVGDGIGCLAAAAMIGNTKVKNADDETVVARKKIKGKNVIIVKARGPGGRLGKLGRVVEAIIKKEKIAKIITIDAALKLEGEKLGATAEGTGVAIGGAGVDRAYIEAISTRKAIPLDTFVIKMGQEEAIQPMKKEIIDAKESVIKAVEDDIAGTKGKIILIGVGNTTGVGNDGKSADAAEKEIRKVAKAVQEKEDKNKKFKWLFGD